MFEQMKVNGQTAPVGISREPVRFSFVRTDTRPTPTVAALYGADGRKLEERTLAPDDGIGFSFDTPLDAGTVYRWSLSDGAQTQTASFETGIMLADGWISPAPGDAGKLPCCPALTARFPSPTTIIAARLYITGLGLYAAYLNGHRLGDARLTPGLTDYDDRVRVSTYDPLGVIRPGAENVLRVLLGDGWYRGRYGIGKPTDRGGGVWGHDLRLCARLVLTDGAGRQTVISTADPSLWQTETTAIISSSIYDGEIRDDTSPNRVIGGAIAVPGIHRTVPAEGAPIRVIATATPTVCRSPAGEYILDFGENRAGVVRVTGAVPAGKTLTLTHGELLQDGYFCRDNLRTAKAVFSITGDGAAHVTEPLFTYFGFRYVLCEGLTPDELDGLAFEAQIYSSASPQTLTCVTDHEGLNRLIANVRRSMESHFMDIPTDCPQRDERLGRVADAWIFAPTACRFSDCRAFYGKFLRALRNEQKRYYGGGIPLYAPSLKGEAGHGGAGCSDCAAILPMALYDAYGDPEILRAAWQLMHDYAEYLLSSEAEEGGQGGITHRVPSGGHPGGDRIAGDRIAGDRIAGDRFALDGLSPRSPDGGTDKGFIRHAFLYLSLSLTAKAAAILDLPEDAARYADHAARVRHAFRQEYVSPAGHLTVNTQTAHLLALAFGLTPDPAVTVKDLHERLRRDLFGMKTGLLGTPFLLPILFANGLDDDAWRILLSHDCPGWLYAVDRGATTVWERWNAILPDGHLNGTSESSLNHCAFGCVCEAIFGYVVGLRAALPGWSAAVIDPRPSHHVRRVSFSMETPAGRYTLRWRLCEDGCFTVSGSVPPRATATVRLPDGTERRNVRGDFAFTVTPSRDLLHPFTTDTPLIDLIRDPDASALIRRLIPQAYPIITGDNPDYLTLPVSALCTLPLSGMKPGDMEKLAEELREIEPSEE